MSGGRQREYLPHDLPPRSAGSVVIASADAARLEVRRRWFRWSLFNDGQPLVGLRGITRTEAAALSRAVRQLALAPVIADALAWHAAVARVLAEARTGQRWIPAETASQLAAARPGSRLLDRVRAAGCEPSLTAGQLEAAAFLDADLDAVIVHANEQVMASELSARRSFSDTIEKTPLTGGQARAAVCFGNRVQVLAAAGSGKTSVMVARAAYAVSRGFAAADRILLLAFSKAAAAERQERAEARFAARRPAPAPAGQPARHVPHRARRPGPPSRLHRDSRPDRRLPRIPGHDHRRPRTRPGHARTPGLPARRRAPPLLRGPDSRPPGGRAHHRPATDDPVRHRTSQ